MRGLGLTIAAGVVAALALTRAATCGGASRPTAKLVAEDASAPLARIAIHYAPAFDARVLVTYRQLLAALPDLVEIDVEVANERDFARFVEKLGGVRRGRLHAVIVGAPITTWSRDRYAALDTAILAPPAVETPFAPRAGDSRSPTAISQALYGRDPRTASFVFEGGDIAATPRYAFLDANLPARSVGRGDVSRAAIDRELRRLVGQELVWLGDAVGDVPRHHIMMYMVPLDDTTVAVGDVRAGVALLADTRLALADPTAEAARFDRAAALLVGHGFRVVRVPVAVLGGGGSYITYTNALFDRRGDTRIIYMPTYNIPALDDAGAAFWRSEGFEVHPIDVSRVYTLNGSLGCLVNVLARQRSTSADADGIVP